MMILVASAVVGREKAHVRKLRQVVVERSSWRGSRSTPDPGHGQAEVGIVLCEVIVKVAG